MIPALLSVAIPQAVLYLLFGLLGSIAAWFLLSLVAAFVVYSIVLHRWSKRKWTRECSSDDARQHEMYAEGLEWGAARKGSMKEVSIERAGLTLYGEYYDLGFDRTAVIISGRTEGLRYAYYFAKPYAESGFNIFVFDQRAHGISDGHCNTLGFEESKDLLKWCEYLHDVLGSGPIYLHGICIGSACGLYALIREGAPDYIIGLTADGMYSNFYRSFVNHAREKVRHTFPVSNMVDWWMRLFTGHSMRKGPIDCIDRYHKPLLMLHSLEDTYSVPKYAEELYGKASASDKRLVWFAHGQHSMLRYTDKEKYDATIKEYLKTHFSDNGA